MRIHDLKLCNMTQALSLSVFIAFKGTVFYILFTLSLSPSGNERNTFTEGSLWWKLKIKKSTSL